MTQADRVAKALLFSKMMVQAAPGVEVSYLEGVQQNPKQAALHFPEEGEDWRFMVASTGQRAGKTIAAAAEVVWQLSQEQKRIWICAPTYDLCDRCFEYVWDWVVRQGVLNREKIESKSKTKDNRQIQMVYGSWVRCKSTDNGGESCVGEQLDFLVWDECAPQTASIWEEKLFQRLANRKGSAMLTSSPRGYNWFKDYFDRGDQEEYREVGWRCVTFSQLDNPYIDAEDILAQKHTMAEAVWEQDVMGRFVHFSGLVWPMFRDELYNPVNPAAGGHLFDPADPPYVIKETMGIRSIDIGTRHPTACLWHGVTPNDDVLTYQEYVEEGYHDHHARQIKARTAHPVAMTYISHDASRVDGLSQSVNSPAMVYLREGIPTVPAPRDFSIGRSEVAAYMTATLEHKPHHPKWLISTDCKETRKCLQTYVYDDLYRGKEKDAPEKPKKYKDDPADALRYGLVSTPRYNSFWMREGASMPQMITDEVKRYGYHGTPFERRLKAKRKRRAGGPRIAGVA